MDDAVQSVGKLQFSIGSMAARVLVVQAALGVALSLVFWLLGGFSSAYSAFLGVLCALLPNAAFFLMFRRSSPTSTIDFLKVFKLGEGVKILLTIIIFVVVIFLHIPDLRVLPLFIGFALVFLGHWVSLIFGLKTEVPNGA